MKQENDASYDRGIISILEEHGTYMFDRDEYRIYNRISILWININT